MGPCENPNKRRIWRMDRPLPSRPRLRDRIRAEAKNHPGVYRFLGPRAEVLYVGKSVRIRSRLLSYFRGRSGEKRTELLRVAEGVEWEYHPTEFEALIRELRLIRAFRPRFNVRHRRERHFAWIRLTPGPAPRLVATRRPRADGSRYFGPFPARRRLPALLRELATEVGLRDCPDRTPMHLADQLDLLESERTPKCLRAELGSCPGPCAGLCTEDEYRSRVRDAVSFLTGVADTPLDSLSARMDAAARDREFERAARLRDRRERLRMLRDDVREFDRHLRSLHFLYHPVSPGRDAGPSYLILGGRLRMTLSPGHRALDPTSQAGGRLRELVESNPPDPTTLSAGEREELFVVARWFRRRPEELERTRPIPGLGTPVLRDSRPSPGSVRTPPDGRVGPRGASDEPVPSRPTLRAP
jgi:excinuclease ABC subunit C